MTDTTDAPDDDLLAGQSEQQEQFPIVGIGASAGGIEALKSFFSQVSSDSGAAYVVILHLSPDHESRLAELLQSSAAIPVLQVRERLRVEPNCAYVIPPNQSLSMDDGHLALAPITRQEQRHAPIDLFFRTLAESQRSRAVCVVLSGTGTDGSTGMKRIKEYGGICIAQQPSEAVHGDMPRHAIATELVDDILPAAEIPAKILTYARQRAIVRQRKEKDEQGDARVLHDILSELRLRTGHDFSTYKPSTVLRRIERRVAVHELGSLEAYAAWLRTHADEPNALLRDLLISVTNFFRDPTAFEALEDKIIPKLFENKGSDNYVRVWVAGCATGEEVYSIAMLLCERVTDPIRTPSIQIFATDIDETALSKARTGFYTASDVADVSPARLKRFFVPERDGYRVRKELREIVLFAAHNVIKHPPYSHLDLITCRNLLIYINRAAQQRIVELFHFGLNPSGYLFLGTSESLDGGAELFAAVDKGARIFQSRPVEQRVPLMFPNLNPVPVLPIPDTTEEWRKPRTVQERVSRQALHQRLLEQYAPPSVVVNDDGHIVHVSDNAGRYLRIGGGEPSSNLVELVRPELKLDLRTALYEATRQRAQVRTRPIGVALDGAMEHVSLIVRPFSDKGDVTQGFALVLFDAESGEEAQGQRLLTASPDERSLVEQLESDLMRLDGQLRLTIEQHELQREELKASNEELQSINEELRSATEELETGKEELQSYNEELSTVNQELKIKIDELTEAHNDTRNFMNCTDTAVIFVDRALRVRRFTPRARDVFNLIPGDIGRPLLDMTPKVRYDGLTQDIETVLDALQTIEREVQSQQGQWFIARVLPYRTEDDRIDGVVLTFTDISVRKQMEDDLRVAEEQFRRAIEDAPIPIIMQAEDGQVLQLSRSWTELTGYSQEEVPTVHAWLSRAYGEGADAVREHMQELFSGARQTIDVEFTIGTRSAADRYWSFNASSPGRLRDGRRFIVGMAVDITDRKRAAEAVARSEARAHVLLDNIRDYAIFTTDAQGVIDSWNQGAQRIFGFSESEAIGQPGSIIFTPEDRSRGAPEEEMRVAREKGAAADERWHIRKNGERFYASGVLSCVSDGSRIIGYSKVAQDLTAKKEVEEKLRQAREELGMRVAERTRELAEANESLRLEAAERQQSDEMRVRLLRQLVHAQENERRRIARELHDQLGQQVSSLSVKLAALKSVNELAAPVREELATLEKITKQLDADVDYLVWEIRPTALDDLGLHDALSDYVISWSKHFGVAAELHSAGLPKERLPSEIETVLYRVTQEALNNIAKHAQAEHVDVILERRADHISLIIEDDGVGFDPEAPLDEGMKAMGLVGIRERVAFTGGTVTIESSPGEGTTVFVRIPWQQQTGENPGARR